MVDWKRSWESFVLKIVELVDQGVTPEQLASYFAGEGVRWTGTLQSKNLSAKFVPGIELSMPKVQCKLRSGRILSAEFIYLLVPTENLKSWAKFAIGQQVTFNAQIKREHKGSFLPLAVVEHHTDEYVHVEITIEQRGNE